MANDVTLPGTGDIIAARDDGSRKHQTFLPRVQNVTHAAVAVGTSSTAVVAANAENPGVSLGRLCWPVIWNDSDMTVYLKVGAAAVVGEGLPVPHQSFATFPAAIIDQRAINAIHAGIGTKTLLVTGA